MMAKKKAGGKKKGSSKGSSSSGNYQTGRKSVSADGGNPTPSGESGGNGAGSAVAVADAPGAPSISTASGASTAVAGGEPPNRANDDADIETAVIQNRVADAKPVSISSSLPIGESSPGPATTAGGKGFGAPTAPPKSVSKRSSGETPRGGMQSEGSSGESSSVDSGDFQPIQAPGTTQNPMSASAVPMDPSRRRVR